MAKQDVDGLLESVTFHDWKLGCWLTLVLVKQVVLWIGQTMSPRLVNPARNPGGGSLQELLEECVPGGIPGETPAKGIPSRILLSLKTRSRNSCRNSWRIFQADSDASSRWVDAKVMRALN